MATIIQASDNFSDNVTIPHVFSSGTTISSGQMNENFQELVKEIIELKRQILYMSQESNITFNTFSFNACENLYYYGTAGLGVNNGQTCNDVCQTQGGNSINWTNVEEQKQFCFFMHPTADRTVTDPNNFSYPYWNPQTNNCNLNQDGSKSNNFEIIILLSF